MIEALVRILWLAIKRDRITLLFTFVLPIVFFSIFAMIFRNMGGGGMGSGGGGITVIVVDEDRTEISRRFIEALRIQDMLDVRSEQSTEGQQPGEWLRDEAIDAVYRGRAPVAVVVRKGFGGAFADFAEESPFVEVIHDPANPMAHYAVSGLIQAASFQAAPEILMERGLEQLERFAGDAAPTEAQRRAIEGVRRLLAAERWRDLNAVHGKGEHSAGGLEFTGLVRTESRNVRSIVAGGADRSVREQFSTIPYYAAGIGVMFLLFSMSSAAGSIIKEHEIGTLDRVLTTSVSIGTLLASKWLFYAAMGFVQIFVMFAWAAAFFGLELWTAKNLTGFVIMTAVTAAAASGFGMMLATICRSRGQLDGISAVVILMMSAVGGSMVPRFVMPEFMQSMSQFTFNGQALNGYLNVFWHSRPEDSLVSVIISILPSIAALLGMCIAFLFISRMFARRWEAA